MRKIFGGFLMVFVVVMMILFLYQGYYNLFKEPKMEHEYCLQRTEVCDKPASYHMFSDDRLKVVLKNGTTKCCRYCITGYYESEYAKDKEIIEFKCEEVN